VLAALAFRERAFAVRGEQAECEPSDKKIAGGICSCGIPMAICSLSLMVHSPKNLSENWDA
jgi:hypothetical protein